MANLGSCGIDCDKCDAYIATANNDQQLREETAKKWSAQFNMPCKPEDISCTSCRAEGAKIGHCNVCKVRLCCIEKELQHCGQCDQMPCETLTEFYQMFPDKGAENTQRLKQNAGN